MANRNGFSACLLWLICSTALGAESTRPAPSHWASYAQLVGGQLQGWLSDDEQEPVHRLHRWLQQRILNADQGIPPSAVVVRVWITANGDIDRLDFDSLGNVQADADLRLLLHQQRLAEPPPADMRQPLVLRLRLDFPPPDSL